MADTQNSKERLKEITDSIEQGIQDLFQSEGYAEYLRTMSRFHRYSLNNTMLIFMQKPDATLVAGFNKWRDQFGRSVMKSEKSIKIIAPTPFKKKIEQEKLDPDTSLPMRDREGKVMTEEVEIKIPMYKVVSVFDVSQTDGKPLPQLAASLTGDVRQYEVFMEALRRSAPVPIAFEKMAANTDGYFSESDQRIAIHEGMSEVQTVSAAIHEIAHSKLHNYEKERLATAVSDETKEPPKPKDRRTEEVEAESVSFAVCAYYGIPTGENSFGYIASWSKDKNLPELRASLETINKTASGLIDDIDRNYAEIAKERGIDLSMPEQAAESPEAVPERVYPIEPPLGGGRIVAVEVTAYDPDAPLPPLPVDYPMPDPTVSMEDMNAYGYTQNDMLPLSREKAVELFDKDMTVYMLRPGNGAGMAFDRDDIDGHIGLFGINREEWNEARAYLELAAGHELTERELESTFLGNPADAFAIYQLKRAEETHDLRFEPLERIEAAGLTVERGNYELAYTSELRQSGETNDQLNNLFYRFNEDRPEDFKGHSLSVSDIVALKQNGSVSCHYLDSFGFQELPRFLQPDNYLKSAEMAMEDDYGMIDGIINNGPKPTVAELEATVKAGGQISLLDLANAVKSERHEERLSVIEQLKSPPPKREHTKTAPVRGAEMEL